MLLTIDIGNTNIVFGVFEREEIVAHWRTGTHTELTADDIATSLHSFFHLRRLQFEDIHAVVIASVVPPFNDVFHQVCRDYFHVEPLFVEPGVRTGIAVEYEDPREVGADRIANGVAAFEEHGGPVIIVDFGTATTVDIVNSEGHYLGGAIAPGIGISVDALFQHAARLPRADLVKPKRAIGRNTISSMQSGIFFGYIGLVKELLRRFLEEMQQPAKIVATGGLAPLLSQEIPEIHVVDPLLTLKGLRLIYDRNREKNL